MPETETKQRLICFHCGACSDDVHYHGIYVGGQGQVFEPSCDNVQACWQRWERKVKDGTLRLP